MMPTDDDLKAFAKQLPSIYRDILSAFPAIEPNRKAGFGLAFQTIAAHFYNRQVSYGLGEIEGACQELTANGFLEIKNGIFAHPTDLGERLISVISGHPVAAKNVLPALPTRTW
jgi:hypothetical protein